MDISSKVALDSNKVKPFGMQDKVGYMLGDVGSCLLFNFIGSYLLVFYTDVFGISAAAVGTLMVVSRVWVPLRCLAPAGPSRPGWPGVSGRWGSAGLGRSRSIWGSPD